MQLVLAPPPRPNARAMRLRRSLVPGLALLLAGYAVAVVALWYQPVKPAAAANLELAVGLRPTPTSVELDWREELMASTWSFEAPAAELSAATDREGLHLSGEARGQWWLRRASAAYHRGRLEAAFDAYQQARDLLPNAALPCLRAARIALALERAEEAATLARCARDREPTQPLPYLYLGAAEQLAGHDDAAARAYFEFAARAPGHPRTGEAEKVGARLLVEVRDEGRAFDALFAE